MTDNDQPGSAPRRVETRRENARQERLAAALRQNLSRRKAQSRARDALDLGAPGAPSDPDHRKD